MSQFSVYRFSSYRLSRPSCLGPPIHYCAQARSLFATMGGPKLQSNNTILEKSEYERDKIAHRSLPHVLDNGISKFQWSYCGSISADWLLLGADQGPALQIS